MVSDKKLSHHKEVTSASIELQTEAVSELKADASADRRRLFSFGIPAAAALLATACGKAVFGGDQKRIKKAGSDSSSDSSGAGGSGTNKSGSNSGSGGQNDISGENGNAANGNTGNGNTANGNGNGNATASPSPTPIGNDNMTGTNGNTSNTTNGNGNTTNGNTGMNNGGPGPVTDDPCKGVGIAIIETKDIPKDSTIVDATGTSGGLKLWGRDKNATVVVGIPMTTPKGSTVMIGSPVAAGSTQISVLASRLVMEPEVDATSPAAGMVIFEAINLSLIPVANPDLVFILLTPDNVAKREVFSGKINSFQPKSKRYGFKFRDKPVADIQVNFLPDEDGLLSSAQKTAHGEANKYPTFGGETNGFGHDRLNETNKGDAFFAENLRTAGYETEPDKPETTIIEPDLDVAETAHITHAKTKWKFPANFKSGGAIVTDLLERDITAKFAGSTTDYLKDDYTFVVYIPDNPTTPTVYFRYIISVG